MQLSGSARQHDPSPKPCCKRLPQSARHACRGGDRPSQSDPDELKSEQAAAMTRSRQLHLGAFMRPVGIHTAWWRYPGAYPDANFNLRHLIRFAQTLERGRFDAWFMADHLAVLNMPMAALKRSATATSFDPLTLLPALAMVTEHLGLIATASTTFEPPYVIARRFASLDHISGGRAGWNLVTTSNPDAALNFGLTEHMEHGDRYRRARILRCRHRLVGQLGRRRLHPRCRERRLFRSRATARARPSSSRCAGPSTSPGRSRAGRSSC